MEDLLDPSLWQHVGWLGASGIAFVAIWFLWQRLEDHKTATEKSLEAMDKQVVSLNQDVLSVQQSQKSAVETIVKQNTEFQARFLETRPTREEMNRSFDQMKESLRELLQPLQQDTAMIKNWILTQKQKD